MKSKNNLSNILSKLLTLNNNSIESFAKINEAITSDNESVTLNIENADGSKDTFTIPSFGYLKNSIERLNNNITTISNINGGGSSIRLSDGTYRRVMSAKLPSVAPTITKLNSINNFKIKSNYFFENLMNPMLCVTIDLTNQINNDVERLLVNRYILDTDTEQKKEFFNNKYSTHSSIDYNTFINDIVTNNISYVLDEEIIQLTPQSPKYSGMFDVLRITNDKVVTTINGAEVVTNRKLIKLNTLDYTDNSIGIQGTMRLNVGDSVEIVSEPCDTRYIVKQVDSSTNTIVLELVEGNRIVKIGSNILRVSSIKDKNVSIDVNVGYNERCVVFVKAIDSHSNMVSSNWSPGTGFYTNDLTFKDSNGLITLQQYYQKSVIDFGTFLMSYANDWYPTSIEGVVPNAPILDESNFKVVKINKQVTDSESITRIKQLNSEKNNLQDQITSKSIAISNLKNKINSTNYVSNTMRDADVSELQSKINEYDSIVKTYSSKVNTITSLSDSSSLTSVSPKYRVRGFWEMPLEQSTPSTGKQAIIKFKIRYRYLSIDGAANNVEQIGNSVSGSFSNYNIIESVLRERIKDKNGVYYWKPIDLNDSEEVNINQLDIPITKGEKVEIQVKSISEAGFPNNPIESEWSEPIIITFPEEYNTENPLDGILKQNSSDESQLIVENLLFSKGISSHVNDTFSSNGSLFLHTSNNIASGFLTDEQRPISLYQKLLEMQNTINQLQEIIGNSTGVMYVTLSDENGNVYELKENTLNRIYGGSYMKEVNKLSIKKGAIITKNFYLNISNNAQTGLRLLSRIAGSRSAMVNESNQYMNNNNTQHSDYPNIETFDKQDNTYNTFYRYDLAPINLYSPNQDNIDGIVSNPNGYQSAQCKNQFINVRFYDISGDIPLYSRSSNKLKGLNIKVDDETPIDVNSFFNNEVYFSALSNNNSTINNKFIWFGDFDNNNNPITCDDNNKLDSNIGLYIHIDHPYISSKDEWYSKVKDILSLDTNGTFKSYDEPKYDNVVNRYLFRLSNNQQYTLTNNSKKATTLKKVTNATIKNVINLQTPYEYITEEIEGINSSDNSWYNIIRTNSEEPLILGMTHKIGYLPEDQYLIGEKSCTSYLFLNPKSHLDIQVDGDSKNSSKVITGGTQISIPLTFQYRMTDYWGEGEQGIGRIMGKYNLSNSNRLNNNLIYQANRIGIDIWNSKDLPISFDIEIYATYAEENNKISPDSMVQYTASTMLSAINASSTKKVMHKKIE